MKMNKNLYETFSLNIWKKLKTNLFYEHEHKNKINFFSHNKLKYNLEPKT